MTTVEALSMLIAAREGVHGKDMLRAAIPQFRSMARSMLTDLGMKEEELNDEYPQSVFEESIKLVDQSPVEFARRAREAAAWLLQRN